MRHAWRFVGALRDGQVGHGFPRHPLYGHLMYAEAYMVGKLEQCNRLLSQENVLLACFWPPDGRILRGPRGRELKHFIWSYNYSGRGVRRMLRSHKILSNAQINEGD